MHNIANSQISREKKLTNLLKENKKYLNPKQQNHIIKTWLSKSIERKTISYPEIYINYQRIVKEPIKKEAYSQFLGETSANLQEAEKKALESVRGVFCNKLTENELNEALKVNRGYLNSDFRVKLIVAWISKQISTANITATSGLDVILQKYNYMLTTELKIEIILLWLRNQILSERITKEGEVKEILRHYYFLPITSEEKKDLYIQVCLR